MILKKLDYYDDKQYVEKVYPAVIACGGLLCAGFVPHA
jgi:hypothetical protein